MCNSGSNLHLSDLARIRAGYSFRGKIIAVDDGETGVLQMRDVDPVFGVQWDTMVRTGTLSGCANYLQDGDIVFAAKGSRNHAVCIESAPDHIVLSPHFFHITVHNEGEVLPMFLAWQLNQPPVTRYFAANAEGARSVSIKKGVLASLPIAVPSIAKQEAIISLDRACRGKQQVLHKMSDNHKQVMDAIGNNFLADFNG